jgi:HK97 family phage major capsid protein
MSNLDEIKTLIVDQGDQLEAFKAQNEKRLDDLEKRLNRPRIGGDSAGLDEGAGAITTETKAAVNMALRAFLKSGDVRALTEAKAMSVGVDPDGGFLVVPYLAQQIAMRMREISLMRQYARVLPLSSGDAFEEPREDGDADATWAGETSSRPETQAPTIALTRIPLRELYAMPKVTQKLLDTSNYDVAEWLGERVANRFARSEGAAFVAGTGVNRPRGLTTYQTAATADSSRAWGVFEHVATTQSGDFASSNPADVLIETQAKLKTGYLTNAAWFMSRATAARVRKLKATTSNDYLWQPSMAAGSPPTLLGHPVRLLDDMPAMGADSLSIVFGDMRAAYTIVEKPGLRMLADPFTAKPYVLMYAYQRVGGDVTDFEALKFVKFGTS